MGAKTDVDKIFRFLACGFRVFGETDNRLIAFDKFLLSCVGLRGGGVILGHFKGITAASTSRLF